MKNNSVKNIITRKNKWGLFIKNFFNFFGGFLVIYGAIKLGLDLSYLFESFIEGKNILLDNYGGLENPINIETSGEDIKQHGGGNHPKEEQESVDDFPSSPPSPPSPPSSPFFSFKGFLKKGEKINIEEICRAPKWWQKQEEEVVEEKMRIIKIKKFLKEYFEEKEKLNNYKKQQKKIFRTAFKTTQKQVHDVVHQWSHIALDLKRGNKIREMEKHKLQYDINNLKDELEQIKWQARWWNRQHLEQKEKVLENLLEEAYKEWLENLLEEGFHEFVKNEEKEKKKK